MGQVQFYGYSVHKYSIIIFGYYRAGGLDRKYIGKSSYIDTGVVNETAVTELGGVVGLKQLDSIEVKLMSLDVGYKVNYYFTGNGDVQGTLINNETITLKKSPSNSYDFFLVDAITGQKIFL